MLKNYFEELVIDNFPHEPTSNQIDLIKTLCAFLTEKEEKQLFLMTGYAGTGKTSVISTFVNVLHSFKRKTVLLAPTGRAAKVLSSYSKNSAFTIHKKIYRQLSAKDGFGKFVLDRNLHTQTLFIVDEASMISNQAQSLKDFGTGRLLDDLISYVYSGAGCKLILIGDSAQLPPVGTDISPALDAGELKTYGINVITSELTQVVRQEKLSGILHNATLLRNKILNNDFTYPKFEISSFKDIKSITGQELQDELESAYSKYGKEEVLLITRSNKSANMFNQAIRSRVLWQENEINAGDNMMIVKNNYFWIPENEKINFIANGDIVEINRVIRTKSLYDFTFIDADISLQDYGGISIEVKIILDSINRNAPALNADDNKLLFYNIMEDYQDIKPKSKQYIKVKENPYFNALQVKFAYAVTCHKSQGGQWDAVFIDQGYITDENMNKEFFRWLYTALTRAKKEVYLVNFNPNFFNS